MASIQVALKRQPEGSSVRLMDTAFRVFSKYMRIRVVVRYHGEWCQLAHRQVLPSDKGGGARTALVDRREPELQCPSRVGIE